MQTVKFYCRLWSCPAKTADNREGKVFDVSAERVVAIEHIRNIIETAPWDLAIMNVLLRAKITSEGQPFDCQLWFGDVYVRTSNG